MGLKCPISIDQLTFNEPIPYKIEVDRHFLAATKKKLELTRYPEDYSDFGEDDWSQAAKVSRVMRLVQFWKDEYDWEKQETHLNTILTHHLVKLAVPGHGPLVLHYTHNISPSPTATPLLLSHGWPGSITEAAKALSSPLITTNTNPEEDPSSSFHLVAPSIPGFGFSPAPPTSVGPTVVARAYKLLMTDVLGYATFATRGGDFGALVTRSVALQYPTAVVRAQQHVFPARPRPTSVLSAPLAWLRWRFAGLTYGEWEREVGRDGWEGVDEEEEEEEEEEEGGGGGGGGEVHGSGCLEQQQQQRQRQRRRRQTLGIGLGDSPVGLLAWFVEKLHAWMEVGGGMSDEEIITLVMLHWIQGATPGLRFYREAFGEMRREEEKRTFEAYVAVPTGVSMYPNEQSNVANIKFWKEHTQGGHFSSLERPDLFVADLREFVRVPAVEKSIMKSV